MSHLDALTHIHYAAIMLVSLSGASKLHLKPLAFVLSFCLNFKGCNKNMKVQIESENKAGPLEGVLLGGTGQNSLKGLILVHEWWGLDKGILDDGALMARETGMTILMPDLYRGKVTDDYHTARHYMSSLDYDGAVLDIQAAARHLLSTGCSKVRITGFSLGGAVSFLAALKVPEISAAAPFYGIPMCGPVNPFDEGIQFPQDASEMLSGIKIPVQGHFAKNDTCVGFTSPSDYLPLRDKLVSAGVDFVLYEYDAGHSFGKTDGPRYDKEKTDLAFSRLFEFMKEKLS